MKTETVSPGLGVTAGARRSAGHEFENGQTGARDPLPLGFDDLIDCRRAAATGLSGRAGANDIVAIARSIANHLADRAIADSVALADDHRLCPVFEENAGFRCALPIDRSYHSENEVQYRFNWNILSRHFSWIL